MINRHNRLATLAAALLTLSAGVGHADDTDIYVANGTITPSGEPMVMFSLDYRSNLGSTACQGTQCASLIAEGYLPVQASYTFFDVLRAVLKKVMDPLEGVKVGLMINHDNRNNCANQVQANCSNGGYIARGFKLFELGDANGAKAEFNAILAALPVPQGNLSHSYQGKELFFEFYRYLTGQGVYNGHVGFTDFASPPNTNLNVDGPAYDWDASIENAAKTTYMTPISPLATCAKVYTANFMFLVSSQEADSDTEIKKTVANGGMGLTGNPTFPTVIEWLNDVDLADGAHGTVPNLEGKINVTSYFVVEPTKINTTTTAYAQAGGTGAPLPLDSDPGKLIATLQDIFRQILSVSTTFVAASVPVNVFNRAEIINNIYIALFKADEDAKPQWPGNVKKFKLSSLSADDPYLVDADGDSAIAADGRIAFDALSFWTLPASLPAPDTAAGEVAGKDGRTVERGGVGQKLPGFTSGTPGALNSATDARQLFYDTSGGTLAALNSDAATGGALQASLGAASVAAAQTMLAWARGQDVDDRDGDNNLTEPRTWLVGDPLHSRPLPINYGARDGYTKANPAIFIAAGSNDGFLHFFRNTTTAGAESGAEVWGFMPRAVMGKVPVLRTNATGVKHPSLVDGSPVSYLADANTNGSIDTGEDAWLFFGLRRGGTSYYGLDVSVPTSPSLLWTINQSGNFAELGQTFSDPRVIKVATSSGTVPALIFGGGFDTNKDADAMGTNDSVGKGLYIVNAETGALIWKAVGGSGADSATVFTHEDLLDSIPSAISVVDSDGNGVQDRAYVGDTGGNVWRADFNGTDTTEWQLTKLATLGRHAPAADGKADDRRFFHRPDIIQSLDEDGPFDAVIIGSGDREDPLDKGGVTANWAFMIKDRNVDAGSGADSDLVLADLGDVTNTCLALGETCSAALNGGWALRLDTAGEKSLATATTISNTVYFTTYLPGQASSAGTCGPREGTGRLYAVSIFDASARRNYDVTTERNERYTELDSEGIPAEVVSLPPNSILRPDLKVEKTGAPIRFETYWYQAEDGDL